MLFAIKNTNCLFSHRNGAVRKVAAQSLLAIVEKMGASRILTQSKEVTEKLLPTTAQFLMDGMPLTRHVVFHLIAKIMRKQVLVLLIIESCSYNDVCFYINFQRCIFDMNNYNFNSSKCHVFPPVITVL